MGNRGVQLAFGGGVVDRELVREYVPTAIRTRCGLIGDAVGHTDACNFEQA